MSAISKIAGAGKGDAMFARRERDPRVVRSRAAALEAARTLFLENGYAGTTMDEIAAVAGLARRTLYNNYPDKETLFIRIVGEMTTFAGDFARGLNERFSTAIDKGSLAPTLYDLGERLALGIIRPEVVAIRRLLIGEARTFPTLAQEYFDAAPGQVIAALAAGFAQLAESGNLRVLDPQRAAAQFAYLIAGEHLDRAMLVGTVPSKEEIIACARDGVETFLTRYAV